MRVNIWWYEILLLSSNDVPQDGYFFRIPVANGDCQAFHPDILIKPFWFYMNETKKDTRFIKTVLG